MLTPEHIRSVWIKIAVPFGFALLLLVIGLVFRLMNDASLATPGAFLCLGGAVGVLLFGMKAVQFLLYLKRNKS